MKIAILPPEKIHLVDDFKRAEDEVSRIAAQFCAAMDAGNLDEALEERLREAMHRTWAILDEIKSAGGRQK
jgi:hypothetical protein